MTKLILSSMTDVDINVTIIYLTTVHRHQVAHAVTLSVSDGKPSFLFCVFAQPTNVSCSGFIYDQ